MTQAGNKKESLLYPVVFMAILAFTTAAVLSSIYFLTYETVSQNKLFVFNSSIIRAAGHFEEKSPQQAEEFIKNLAIENKLKKENYLVFEQNGEKTIVVIHQESGLWGIIRAAVGFRASNMEISGIEFIEQNETPGLGAKITEEWFKSSVRSKFYPVGTGEKISPENRIDAITGATVTTNAVVNLINNAHKIAENINRRQATGM